MTPGRAEAGLAVRGVTVPGGRRRLERDLGRLARHAADLARLPVSLSFALVSDEEMARLHARFSGIEGPTDVLSFPLQRTPLLLGEVVISADTARREAARRGHSPYDETLLYAVHGVLHLLGHDDHEAADRRRMRRAERRALAVLGRPAVFGGRRRTKNAEAES